MLGSCCLAKGLHGTGVGKIFFLLKNFSIDHVALRKGKIF